MYTCIHIYTCMYTYTCIQRDIYIEREIYIYIKKETEKLAQQVGAASRAGRENRIGKIVLR